MINTQARKTENLKLVEEIKNTPLFKEYVEDMKSTKDAFDEFMFNINEKAYKDMPLLAKRIVEDVNHKIELSMMYRIGDVYDNLDRYGKVTIGIDLTEIEENIREELKEMF